MIIMPLRSSSCFFLKQTARAKPRPSHEDNGPLQPLPPPRGRRRRAAAQTCSFYMCRLLQFQFQRWSSNPRYLCKLAWSFYFSTEVQIRNVFASSLVYLCLFFSFSFCILYFFFFFFFFFKSLYFGHLFIFSFCFKHIFQRWNRHPQYHCKLSCFLFHYSALK